MSQFMLLRLKSKYGSSLSDGVFTLSFYMMSYQVMIYEDSWKHLRLILGEFQTSKMAFQSRFNPNSDIFEKSFLAIRAFSEKDFRKSLYETPLTLENI